jgi:hypothetical protein
LSFFLPYNSHKTETNNVTHYKPWLLTYTHTYHGSKSVTYRQYDVEQVINTQSIHIYREKF